MRRITLIWSVLKEPHPFYFGSQAKGRYRLLCVWDRPDKDTLLSRIGDTAAGAPLLVFYFGVLKEGSRRRLARRCIEWRRTFVVLDDILTGYVAAVTCGRLSTFFACALPFTWLEPFVTTASLSPPEMFFGREAEISAIKDPMGPSFIYGGRQLGKTALLRHVERSFHQPERGQIAKWIDLKVERLGFDRPIERIWLLLAHKLAEDTRISPSINVFESLRDRLEEWFSKNPTRRILLLLDEADIFLERDGESDFVISTSLKHLMEVTGRHFKVVFAGLHNVQRTVRSANHPLGHYQEPICIGPLIDRGEWREARELIELPLRMVGCISSSRDLVTRILSQTNYFPGLLQLYGQQLLRHVMEPRNRFFDDHTSPPIEITEQAVDGVYTNLDLRNAIRRRINLTLDLDGRYHVLAYALALDYLSQPPATQRDGRPVSWFLQEALVWWPEGFTSHRGTNESIRTILDEMVGLGVFRRLQDGGYTFRSPNVVTLLGTQQEVEEKLQTKPKPPIEFSPARFRQPDSVHGSSGYPRSPLTVEQESRLHERRHGVSVVAGWELAGLDDLGTFLHNTFHDPFFADFGDCRDVQDFRQRLSSLPRTPDAGTRLVFVAEAVPWSTEWLSAALDYCRRRRSPDRHVRIAFVADPLQAWRLDLHATDLSGIDDVSLKPWSEDAVHRWIEDLALAHNAEETKKLAEATGCWTQALYHHYRNLTQSDGFNIEKLGSDTDTVARLALKSVVFSLASDELAEARQVLQDLAVFNDDPLSDDEIVEGLETGDRELRERVLKWAKLLHLVHHVKGGTWVVDAVLVRALRMADDVTR